MAIPRNIFGTLRSRKEREVKREEREYVGERAREECWCAGKYVVEYNMPCNLGIAPKLYGKY